jgi:hypothetical protein
MAFLRYRTSAMPMNVRVLTFVLMLGLVACSGGAATPMSSGCVPISASALVGCRGSDEPGCGMCCTQGTSGCDVQSSPCGSGVYCVTSALPGQCPSGCQPCASCSKSDEAFLCGVDPVLWSPCRCGTRSPRCRRADRRMTSSFVAA